MSLKRLEVTKMQAERVFPDHQIVDGPFFGGQKTVFKCRDQAGNNLAAKIISLTCTSPDDRTSEEFQGTWLEIVKRHSRELKAMTICNSPHLIHVVEASARTTEVEGNPALIYLEEWVEGPSVRHIIQSSHLYADDELIVFAESIAQAIGVLAEHNYVHRDIKPENIIKRNNTGDYVLLDLGLALDLDDESLTKTGLAVGTLPYFSPEQLNPAYKPDLNFRSDLFSLGTVMYELATGKMPYYKPGYTPAKLWDAITSGPSPDQPSQINPHVSNEMSAIIMRLLKANPNMRYRKCAHLLDELSSVLAKEK